MQRLSLNRSDLSGARVSCAGRTPLRRWLAAGLLILHIGGCYSYVPVGNTQLVPGTHVSVALNDQGRVGMASDVGPGVLRITGQLRENHDTLIVMSMNSVNYMDLNVTAHMAGERVAIPRTYVYDFRERRISRSRTWFAVGLAAVGLVASSLIVISGFAGDDVPIKPGPGPGNPE